VTLGLLGVTFGAAFGALFGLIVHAARNAERDVSAIRSLRARRYDLLGDTDIADAARASAAMIMAAPFYRAGDEVAERHATREATNPASAPGA